MSSRPDWQSDMLLRRLRKFLVWMALSFAFGGFLFYASVVVPIGSSVLSTTMQGFVTQRVTNALNASALTALLAVAWDGVLEARWRSRKSNLMLGFCVIAAICCLAGLALLHPALDRLLVSESMDVTDPKQFYQLHRIYLWLSTLLWLCSLPIVWILCADRTELEARSLGSR